MPYLLADSFGGLGQQALAEDQNQRIALAQSMTAATQGLQAGIRSQQAQRALDLQEAAQEFEAGPEGHPEQGMAYKRLALQTAAEQAKAQAEIDRNRIADQWVKIGQEQIDNQKLTNPTVAHQQDLEYNRALLNAQQYGGYEDADEVGAIHPSLTPGQRTAIALVSQRTRAQKDSEYNLAANAADTLNQRDALKKRLADLGIQNPNQATEAPTTHMWSSDATKGKNQAIAEALSQWKTISPKAQKIESPAESKRLGSLVVYDPQSDAYQPAIPTPPWRQAASSAAASPQGPTGTVGAPALGGGTGLTPPASAIPTTMRAPATPAATVPAPAAPAANMPKPRLDPWIYQRVNELVGTGSVDPITAKRQAISEWTAATAAGSLP